MKKFLKKIFSKGTGDKSDKKNQNSSRTQENGISHVIERVDRQIGRAVTRLADR